MFGSFPLGINLAIFGLAALIVWVAGTRLARGADQIARQTRLSPAFVGLLLLATATSLPELATTVTACLLGAPRLAVNNLVGGVALQTAVLAIVDLVAVRGAMTYFTPRPVLLLQATLLILLLAILQAGIALGEPVVLGWIGLWPLLIAGAFVIGLLQTRHYEKHPAWRAVSVEPQREPEETGDRVPLRRAVAGFAAAAAVVTGAGWAVAASGEAVARQTGLGGSFVGATLVAASTSLPEVSTTLAAVRRGAYSMAVSNILGSNAFCLSLLAVADAAYTGGPILDAVDRSASFGVVLGLAMTCVYLWGLVERRDKVVLRMGVDSAIVMGLYAGGLVVLYLVRGSGE